MNILLPVGNKSVRFPNTRPKWILTNPSGNFMIVDSILEFEFDKIDSITIIYDKEMDNIYKFKKGLIENFEVYNLHNKLNLIELDSLKKDQVEAVETALFKIDKNISFLIKDCDNQFSISNYNEDNNFVCFCSLEKNKNVYPVGKSYIEMDDMGIINNIVEKKIIGDKFNCGGYFFKDSYEFLKYSKIDSNNRYVSDVIYNMMLHNVVFKGVECYNYIDWGTIEDWYEFKDKHVTYFIDIDGIVFENSSAYLPPYIGESNNLQNNINFLRKLSSKNEVDIIFVTSRPEKYREITEKQLKENNIIFSNLIMGLQHSKRILVNDFSDTNPYRTCDAINMPRNSDNIEKYIQYNF